MVTSLGMPRLRQQLPVDQVDLAAGLRDRFGRVATDLRLSVIDKCNLRCSYCMPEQGLAWLSREELLTAEEICRLVDIGVQHLGITELRLTGGEPLIRKDLVEIIAAIRAQHPTLPVSMTTNGIGLAAHAEALAAAGLNRVNISLDTLDEERFAQLTRRHRLTEVLAGIRAAYATGFHPVKINAVLMRGINDEDFLQLLQWCLAEGYQLRFIEQMPLDADHRWRKENTVTAAEVLKRVAQHYRLRATGSQVEGSPAEKYLLFPRQLSPAEVAAADPCEALGSVGIIASVTEPFCQYCTRTRITAEGKVMPCLFSSQEYDLRHLLRSAADDEEIARHWAAAMLLKPRAHGTDQPGFESPGFVQPDRSMSAIGG